MPEKPWVYDRQQEGAGGLPGELWAMRLDD
jgi:hypothetical protein